MAENKKKGLEMADRAIYSASSAMSLELKRHEVLARNMAAVNLVGYKKDSVVSQKFGDFLSNQMGQGDADKDLNGTTSGVVKVDFSQGILKTTDRRLDFAIQGDGFFEVQTKDRGTMYTRNGAFFVNKDLTLVTQEGYKVMGTGGELRFDSKDNIGQIDVTDDGMVRVRSGSEDNFRYKEIGKFRIVDTKDRNILDRATGNYFYVSQDNKGKILPAEESKFRMSNGTIEASNSNPMECMVTMIQSQREFEMGQKMIKMLDDRSRDEIMKLLS